MVQNTRLVQWNEDSFAKWWEQNKIGFIYGGVSQIINGALSVFGAASGASSASALFTRSSQNTGTKAYINAQQDKTAANLNLGASAIGLAESIMGDICTYKTQKAVPDNLGGSISDQPMLNRMNEVGFTIYDMGIRGRDAKIIDDFFTRYGYAVKRVKLPNIEGEPLQNLRPHWNYIKTRGATFSYEYVPSVYLEKIKSVYDKGITVWLSLSEVGDYSRDNSARV